MKNPYYPYSVDARSKLEIDYPKADYRYNYDGYKCVKKIILIFSLIGIMICIVGLCYSKSNLVQTIVASILGGLLSLLIWLFTIAHQDKVSLEIAVIDVALLSVEKHIRSLRDPIYFIDPNKCTIVPADYGDLRFRLLQFSQVLSNIYADSELTEKLTLKWFDKSNCTVSEYIAKWTDMIYKPIPYSVEDLTHILSWNEHHIETELLELKEKLLKYKKYILCGNVPVRECDLSKYQGKANTFDKIFNRKKGEESS